MMFLASPIPGAAVGMLFISTVDQAIERVTIEALFLKPAVKKMLLV